MHWAGGVVTRRRQGPRRCAGRGRVVRPSGYGVDAYQCLSMSVIHKVFSFLLRDDLGFAEYLGPPPPPWPLGFRQAAWWAAEPDHPPSTLFRSGGLARLLVLGLVLDTRAGAGRGGERER